MCMVHFLMPFHMALLVSSVPWRSWITCLIVSRFLSADSQCGGVGAKPRMPLYVVACMRVASLAPWRS